MFRLLSLVVWSLCVQTVIIGDVDLVRPDCYHWCFGPYVFRPLSLVMWITCVQTVNIGDVDHVRPDCYHW